METFGYRFKTLRKEKQLTQQQLADIFFTTKASISRYESNIHTPEIETLKQFAEFFDVSIDYLLGTSDTRSNKERITEAVSNDEELLEFWNTLKERPDLQLMFKQTKNLKENDIKQIIKIIKAFEDEEASIGD